MSVDFKAGDRVAIRSWEDMEAEFGLNRYGNIDCEFVFVREMEYLCGLEFEIKNIYNNHIYTEPSIGYNISADMIEHVNNTPVDTDGYLEVMACS